MENKKKMENKKEKLLVLGSSIGTEYIIRYARELGAYTVVTDSFDTDKSPCKLLADEYWMIDAQDYDVLEARCVKEGITGIMAASSEFCGDAALRLCTDLGLPHHASETSWFYARNKAEFVAKCAETGMEVPREYIMSDEEAKAPETVMDNVVFPVIVKPVDGSGSRGINVCNNREELKNGIEKALSFSESGRYVIEEYIRGNDIAALYYVNEGIPELHMLAELHFIELNGKPKMSLISGQSQLYYSYLEACGEKVKHLFEAMDIRNGEVILQYIHKDGHFYIYEMGHRIDGLGMWLSDKKVNGVSFLEQSVESALGRAVAHHDQSAFDQKGKCSANYILWAKPGKVCFKSGREALENTEGIDVFEDRYRPGESIIADGSFMQGAYIVSIEAQSPDDMAERIRLVNEKLKLTDEDGNDMLIRYEDPDFCQRTRSRMEQDRGGS